MGWSPEDGPCGVCPIAGGLGWIVIPGGNYWQRNPPRKHRSTVKTEETKPATPGVREHKHNHHHLKSVSLRLKLTQMHLNLKQQLKIIRNT